MEKSQIKYATITDRLFATIIDLSLLYFIIIPLTQILFPLFAVDQNPINDAVQIITYQNPEIANDSEAIMNKLYTDHKPALEKAGEIFVFQSLIQFLIIGAYIVPLVFKKGQTLGKYILGIKVVDKITLKNLSIAQSGIRYCLYLLSLMPVFLGLLYGGLRKDKRTFHDMLADTIVIYDENRWYKSLWQKIIAKFKA